MNDSVASASPAASVEPRSETVRETDTRWYGYGLVFLRLLGLTLTVMSVGIYVASVLSFIAHDLITCTGDAAACHAPGPVVVRTIGGPGLSPQFVSISIIVRDTIWSLGYWLVAAFLLWRKSDDRMALLAAVALGTFPVVFNVAFSTTLSAPWWVLAAIISFLGSLTFGLFYYVFPSGHFVPSWIRWFFVVQLVYWAY